jgi:hypothetical protein
MNNEKIIIIFLGEDLNYYEKVQKIFKEQYNSFNFEYHFFQTENLFDGCRLIIPISKLKPSLIFLDYSKNGHIYLKLAKYIRDQGSTRKIPIFGLSSFKNDQVEIHKGIISGMRINYIKSSNEIGEIVHNSILSLSADKPSPGLFPEVQNLRFETIGFHFFRIGYLGKDHIHIETNLDLKLGCNLFIQNKILQTLKLSNFKVEKKLKEGLYYNFKYAYNLSFLSNYHFFKKSNVLKSIEQPKKKKSKIEKDKEIEKKKELVKNWVLENKDSSFPKKDKLLVIDHNFTPLVEAKEMIDQYHFSFRVHQALDLKGDIIRELKACVIAIQLDDPNQKTHSEFTNGLKMLKKIIKVSKKMTAYHPLILIFNSLLSSKTLKRLIKYPKIMVFQENLTLVELIKNFKKHHWDEKYYNNNNKIKVELPQKHFFSKNDDDSISFFKVPIEIIAVSETIVTFQSPLCLQGLSVLELSEPVQMALTTFEKTVISTEPPIYEYQSTVNGITEKSLQNLRVFINNHLSIQKGKKE